MMNPKVSIITPCLNSEKTIRDTMESVLHQTYSNIEYIVIDGMSTDKTLDILKEYEPLFHGRMKLISEKDSGIYNAMNKGIRLSTGQIIGIINSDDFYEQDTVQKVVEHMGKGQYQVIYGYCRILGKHDESISVNTNSHMQIFDKIFQHPTCFVTRKTYCRYGLFNEMYKVVADCDLLYRFYQKKVEFIQINEILANYRDGGFSAVNNHKKELALAKFLNGGISFKEFIELILFEI